jgi:MFS family permease
MPTISRETVLIDRRQPTLRWSAVFAGGACSVGLWLLLEMLGVGAGMYAHHAADSAGGMHAANVATRVWSLVAQVIALFVGGMIVGRFAQTYERRLAGLHGLVMWALTSLVGMWATVWVITMITAGAQRGGFGAGTVEISAADTGKALLILGCSMLISLITAVAGAMAGVRKPEHPGADGGRFRTTEPGFAAPGDPVTTAPPYPTPMTGPAAPVIPDGSIQR